MPIAMQQELENHSLVTNNSHATHNLHHIQASKKSIKQLKINTLTILPQRVVNFVFVAMKHEKDNGDKLIPKNKK